MSAKTAIDRIIADGDIFRNFVNGTDSQTVSTDNGPISTLSKFVKDTNAKVVSNFHATSTTQVPLSLGQKMFQIESGKGFVAGQWVIVTAGATNMVGTVVNYSGVTLVVDVTHVKGEGTFANWTVSLSGPPGKPGGEDTAKLLLTMPWET